MFSRPIKRRYTVAVNVFNKHLCTTPFPYSEYIYNGGNDDTCLFGFDDKIDRENANGF